MPLTTALIIPGNRAVQSAFDVGIYNTTRWTGGVGLTGNVATANKRTCCQLIGTLDISPRSAVVCAAVKPVAIISGSKGVEVPRRPGAKAERDLGNISQGRS